MSSQIGQAIGKVATTVAPDLTMQLGTAFKTAVNYLGRSGYAALDSLESGLGKEVTNLLKSQDDAEGQVAGGAISDLKNIWKNIAPADRLASYNNIKTGVAHADPAVNQAIAATKAQQSQFMNELASRGVKVNFLGSPIPINLAPQNFPTVLKQDVFNVGSLRKEALDHLVSSGQFQTRGEAEEALQKLSGMQYGAAGVKPMTVPNMSLPEKFIETDPLVAYGQYGNSSARAMTMHDIFGPSNVNLKSLSEAVGYADGYEAKNLVRNVIDSSMYGYSGMNVNYYRGRTSWENMISSAEGLSKLGTIAIPHSTQSFNTLLKTSFSSMASSLSDMFNNKEAATEFALKSGALVTDTLRDIRDSANGRGWLANMFHYTGFDWERRTNLVLAANAGKHYANELFDKLVANPGNDNTKNLLKGIGLDPLKLLQQGSLMPEDLLTAARRTVDATQFFRNPADLPIAWQKNPFMRTLFLYKNFIFNEGKLIKDTVLVDGLKNGKYQNVAYFLTAFPAAGELIGDLESLVKGQNPQDRKDTDFFARSDWGNDNPHMARYIDNISKLAGFGIFSSMLGALSRHNIVGWLGGPVASDLETGTTGLYHMFANQDTQPLKEHIARSVPVVGKYLGDKVKNQ